MLVFVVAMGVYRVRIAHQHFIQETEAAKEAEMDWDDSALTITVNPMEVILSGMGALSGVLLLLISLVLPWPPSRIQTPPSLMSPFPAILPSLCFFSPLDMSKPYFSVNRVLSCKCVDHS